MLKGLKKGIIHRLLGVSVKATLGILFSIADISDINSHYDLLVCRAIYALKEALIKGIRI